MNEPITLGDVLFEVPEHGAHEIVQHLGRSARLRSVARPRRHLAELELLAQMTTVLKTGLSDLIIATWKRTEAVRESAAMSRQHASDPVYVPLANHGASRSYTPALELYVGEARLARFELQAQVELEVSGAILKIVGGSIVAVGAGTWSGIGSLACNGAALARHATGQRALPGAIALADGVDLAPTADALSLLIEPAPLIGPPAITVDARVVIGRHPSCDVVVADDAAAAAHHAVVYPLGSLLVLEDLDSPGGTWFKDLRMTAPAVLSAGDVFRVGHRSFYVTGPAGERLCERSRDDVSVSRAEAHGVAPV